MIETILTSLAQQGPIVGLLIAVIWYFKVKLKECEEEVKDLHETIREIEKENVTLMIKVSATLEKLTDRLR